MATNEIFKPLADEMAEVILQKLSPLLERFKPQEPPQAEKYLTRIETASLLKISLPTLGEYQKRNLITGYRFGIRVLFKESEIEKCLTLINYGRA